MRTREEVSIAVVDGIVIAGVAIVVGVVVLALVLVLVLVVIHTVDVFEVFEFLWAWAVLCRSERGAEQEEGRKMHV
jgi:hypothetical protein